MQPESNQHLYAFKSFAEMEACGFAHQEFSIGSDAQRWRFGAEEFRTMGVPTGRNSLPNILLAKIEDVRKHAI